MIDDSGEQDFCSNERLAGLKAESEEEYMECNVENIYIHPVLLLDDDYVLLSNAYECYEGMNPTSSTSRVMSHVELSVPSRCQNIFITYEFVNSMIKTFLHGFKFEKSILNENIRFGDYSIDVKFIEEGLTIKSESYTQIFHTSIAEFYDDNKIYQSDIVNINDYLRGDIPTVESQDIEADKFDWVDERFKREHKNICKRIKEAYLESNYSTENIKCYIKDYKHNKEDDMLTIIVDTHKFKYDTEKTLTVSFPNTWDESEELIQIVENVGYGSLDSIKNETVYLYHKNNHFIRKQNVSFTIKLDDDVWILTSENIFDEDFDISEDNKSESGILNKLYSLF